MFRNTTGAEAYGSFREELDIWHCGRISERVRKVHAYVCVVISYRVVSRKVKTLVQSPVWNNLSPNVGVRRPNILYLERQWREYDRSTTLLAQFYG